MTTVQQVFDEYSDVLSWLENLKVTDPSLAEEIISASVDLAASAFDKPFHHIDELVRRSDFSKITPDEKKIMIFFLKLCGKRMH
jgi:hypothetical protein